MFNFIASSAAGLPAGRTICKAPGIMSPESARLRRRRRSCRACTRRWPGWASMAGLAAEPEPAAGAGCRCVACTCCCGARAPATGCARWAPAPAPRSMPASSPQRQVLLAMAISGALAGLVGMNEIAGVQRPAAARVRQRRRLHRHRGGADGAQPPGGHRAGQPAVRRAVPGRRRSGLRGAGLQPRHGGDAAGLDRAVLRRHGLRGRAAAGAACCALVARGAME